LTTTHNPQDHQPMKRLADAVLATGYWAGLSLLCAAAFAIFALAMLSIV
jgi:hypothetical protein